ncbi:MAG: Fe-S cluster assembly protein SufB, partial [Chloroflexota bacterium]|nr:Fe-S cluster assembly protein SufB [Chloroflexota bacterium]
MSQVFDREKQDYSPGFHVAENYAFKSERGLTRNTVEQISEMKGEPSWMHDIRLKSLEHFWKRPMPTWGADLSGIDFDNIYYYIKPVQEQGKTWEEVPAEIKDTFDRLGIPEAERKFLAGVT